MRKRIMSLLLMGAVLAPSISASAADANIIKSGNDEIKIQLTENENEKYSKVEKDLNEKYDYKLNELRQRNNNLAKKGKLKDNMDFDYFSYKGAKRIGFDDVYIKFTKDENSKNINSVKAEKFDYNGYLKELEKEKQLKDCKAIVETSSWLNLTLDVMYFGGNIMAATNYFEWKRPPFFAFTDGHGISVSSGMIWNSNYEANAWNAYADVFKQNSLVKNTQGIVGKADIALTYWNTGQSMAYFSWANSSATMANVQGNYLHNQIGFGGIGIDVTGKPNISLSGSTDSLSAIATIYR